MDGSIQRLHRTYAQAWVHEDPVRIGPKPSEVERILLLGVCVRGLNHLMYSLTNHCPEPIPLQEIRFRGCVPQASPIAMPVQFEESSFSQFQGPYDARGTWRQGYAYSFGSVKMGPG